MFLVAFILFYFSCEDGLIRSFVVLCRIDRPSVIFCTAFETEICVGKMPQAVRPTERER